MWLPLEYAIFKAQPEIVALLIARGAAVDGTSSSGASTVFGYAVLKGNPVARGGVRWGCGG